MCGPDTWLPVALSPSLRDAEVMRVVAGDQDLAVWRGNDGVVRGVDNRCPHRGMRLSFGFVRSNRLNCIYHGWQFGDDGACRYIPAHPDLTPPPTLCASTVACQEHNGLIWIASASGRQLPDPSDEGAPLRSLAVERSHAEITNGLLHGALPTVAGTTTPITASRLTVDAHEGRFALSGATGRPVTVLATFQASTPGKTWLHLQTATPCDLPERTLANRWLEALRRHLEALP